MAQILVDDEYLWKTESSPGPKKKRKPRMISTERHVNFQSQESVRERQRRVIPTSTHNWTSSEGDQYPLSKDVRNGRLWGAD
jgi:hypothetical protein